MNSEASIDLCFAAPEEEQRVPASTIGKGSGGIHYTRVLPLWLTDSSIYLAPSPSLAFLLALLLSYYAIRIPFFLPSFALLNLMNEHLWRGRLTRGSNLLHFIL